jgi:Family of unknown function (DUF5686)/CarboxypepD_reg-like domain
MKPLLLILLCILVPLPVTQAQVLKGKITSQSGEPVQYSTVYINELKQGTTSNTKGDYEIRLPAGKYTVIYQSLGFQPVYATITIAGKTVTKDVVLPVQYYEIPEVRISASGEDPAYGIMRKAIGLAPYYLNNISSYKADVYLKGDLIIKKIPKLLKRSMRIEAKKEQGSSGSSPKIKEGDLYMMESYNEIEYTAPDKYIQKVISSNSTFPEEGNGISPMEYISASFYQPVMAEMAISPLAPNAFSHYNYKYLGASLQGNFVIDKIQVIPKRKSQQLFEGTIYIIEDLWCIQSVDLTNENIVGKITLRQLYIPVQDDIWMPVSHKLEVSISILGFKADAAYAGSVKYIDVKPNLALQKPEILSEGYIRTASNTNPPDTSRTRAKKQIDKILGKDELSNRDMMKLARLMEKESEKSIVDSSKKSLEIKEKTTSIIEKDAGKKDSAYWAAIRPIPLSETEIRSLRVSDSIKSANALKESIRDTTGADKKKQKSKFFGMVRDIGSGHTWSDTSGFSFRNGGLIDLKNLSFNTVDGFIYGFDFGFTKSWKNNRSLSVYPDVRWAFSRDQIMCRINASYRFNGMKHREIFLKTGITDKDINNGGGINTFLNTVTSLMFGLNYLKLYESKYLTLGYGSEIINGLTLQLSSTFESRGVLKNTTSFSIIKTSNVYSDNIPVNRYLAAGSDPVYALRDQNHAAVALKITYIPFRKYRIDNGKKIPMGSDWPTFGFTWEHGINDFGQAGMTISHYDMLRAEVFRTHEMGALSEFRWRVRAGFFADKRNLTFYDFFHFNSQPVPVLINNYDDAFMIPDYYSLSTPEAFGEVHLKYTTPYLLLKLLPGLSNTLIRENISLSYLGSRYSTAYTEIGYSLSEIFFIGELGIYAGFRNLSYKSVGVKLILSFN